MSQETFKVGDFVFAKLRGLQPWPSKIVEVSSRATFYVEFFGDGGHKKSIVKKKDLAHYNDENFVKFFNERHSADKNYQKAVDEINKAIKNSAVIFKVPTHVPSAKKSPQKKKVAIEPSTTQSRTVVPKLKFNKVLINPWINPKQVVKTVKQEKVKKVVKIVEPAIKIDMKAQAIEAQIKLLCYSQQLEKCLEVTEPALGTALRTLLNILKVVPDVSQIMLLKYPGVVRRVLEARTCKLKTDMTLKQKSNLAVKCSLIRDTANKIFCEFAKIVDIPDNDDFWKEFVKQSNDFHKDTSPMSMQELFEYLPDEECFNV